ncbi:hypothetical protein CRYUN_Cryun39dG0008700 [Craigia yunnanensis]
MSSLLDKKPSIYTMKNILSLHVLLDYFGAKKLHQITNGTALAATMFQATGVAPGDSGFVNITDFEVIHISKPLPSAVAEAPIPGPSELNITGIMSAHGCKVYADTLLANPEAMGTYENNINGGLTVFCPLDDPFKAFLPKYKNLTTSQKASFLEFFGVPVYQSLSMLKSNNGLVNTLATDGASKFDFTVQSEGEQVTLKTKVNTVRITGTLLDEQPVAIYTIDKVLMPRELFKAAPTPAPAPEEAADAPKGSKSKSKSKSAPTLESDSLANAPNDDPADQTADDNAAVSFRGERFVVVGLSFLLVFLLL